MIADIFYPISTVTITVLAYFSRKKIVQGLCTHAFTRTSPWALWELTALPIPPAVIVFGFAKNRCAHIFSVLSLDDISYFQQISKKN